MSRSPLLVALLFLFSGLTVGPTTFSAQAPDAHGAAKPFGALTWRNLGPARGGRSIAVAGSSARPNEYYFGATGGGLWKTTNGGATWAVVTDGQITSASVGAVAIAPSNPDVVYIGMGESELRGNIAQGDGVYKSTDAGKTWTHIGLVETQVISKIRINPTNPDLVFVAALGHPAGPNAERGIFRTKDGGKTWDKVLARDDKTGGIELNFDPKNPQVVYAALWEAFRVSHMMSSGGPGSGLFKSTDGGDHWTELSKNPGMPKSTLGKIGVVVSGVDSSRVYALIEAEDGGTFVSDDAGATWKRVSEDRNVRQRAFYYTRIYADPKDKDTVYAPNVIFMKSTDGGKIWKMPMVPHGDNHDMWIDPERTPSDSFSGTTAAQRSPSTAARRGRSWKCRRRSSITSARRPMCRITSAARSRTTRLPACRVRRAGSRRLPAASRPCSTRSAEERAATSRRIRRTRTSSSRAATAARSRVSTARPVSFAA